MRQHNTERILIEHKNAMQEDIDFYKAELLRHKQQMAVVYLREQKLQENIEKAKKRIRIINTALDGLENNPLP